jgi:GntR family transcriptional regulator
VRELRYRTIAGDLRRRIEAREFDAGGLLPSEAELSAAYGASRVTVRRALEELRDEGLVGSRKGQGWFIAVDPLRQALGRLGTIEAQLEASGVRAERRVLDFGFVRAPERVAALLGLRQGGTVLRARRLNLADGRPFARVTVWAAEPFGAGLSRDDVQRHSFYDLLARSGRGVRSATQTIGAAAAGAQDAKVLEVAPGSPVLRCERVTLDRSGAAVLVAEHVFPALRTEFVVELPNVGDDSIAPSGLRLVD